MLRLLTLLLLALTSLTVHAAEERVRKDVSYTSGTANSRSATSLDVYAPAKGEDLPVIVWIHGGGWRIGDKGRVDQKVQAFNEHGMILVSINYRLDNNADYKIQAGNVSQAIRWVTDHIQEYGGSPSRIFLMGHSAGAHLAALVGTDGRHLAAEGLQLDSLQGVILLDGAAYDIPRQIELAVLPRMKEMYLSVFGEDPETQKDASPITHVAAGRQIPPFLILHVADRRDGRIQSEALGQKLKSAGVPAKVVPAENKTHATINREIGVENDLPTREIFQFLDEQLKAVR